MYSMMLHERITRMYTVSALFDITVPSFVFATPPPNVIRSAALENDKSGLTLNRGHYKSQELPYRAPNN